MIFLKITLFRSPRLLNELQIGMAEQLMKTRADPKVMCKQCKTVSPCFGLRPKREDENEPLYSGEFSYTYESVLILEYIRKI